MGANVDYPAADDEPSNAAGGGTVSVKGLEMYYEARGVGRPLVLLHGAMSTIGTSFGAVIRPLAQPCSPEAGDRDADFIGYSMGAGIALELAMRYPELVRGLIVASLAYSNDRLRRRDCMSCRYPAPGR
jgi:pimeloyl-ACP methyl ester carboxylesterase